MMLHAGVCPSLRSVVQVMEQMPAEVLEFLKAELDFFDSVTKISGALYPVPKDERKAGAVKLAQEVSTCNQTIAFHNTGSSTGFWPIQKSNVIIESMCRDKWICS